MASGNVEFNFGDLLGRAWEIFKNNAGVFVGAVLVTALIILVGSSIAQLIHQYLASLVSAILVGPFMLGLAKMSLAGARGQQVQFATLFEGFNNAVHAILANVLMTIFFTVGFMCLIIPGVLIYTLYITTFLFMADGQRDFWGAMESSRRLSQANFMQWLLVAIIAFVLYVAGMALCGVGVLVTAPIALLFVALAYETQRGAGAITVEAAEIP